MVLCQNSIITQLNTEYGHLFRRILKINYSFNIFCVGTIIIKKKKIIQKISLIFNADKNNYCHKTKNKKIFFYILIIFKKQFIRKNN